jgi:conjugal transfer pilus assembly protein TraF
MRVLLLAVVCLSPLLPLPSVAAGFYFREAEGWFWYQREPEPEPAPEAPPSPPPAPSTASTPPPVADTTPDGPKPLSARWIRERIGAYRDAAIDQPTPENVALYLYLQRVALDKSSRFAAATQRAVQLDPFLDEITQRPTATFAANLTNRQAGEHRDALLRQIAATAGVLFFFRSDGSSSPCTSYLVRK